MPEPSYAIQWDQTGERYYETGVDRGVLYPLNTTSKKYAPGVAWNGLTSINENPSGAEATALYADNIKYLELRSAEQFGMTIEAYTYPDEFAVLDGSVSPVAGVRLGQQKRGVFGMCYRTKIGNDVDGEDKGYLLHLVYGAMCSPSSRNYQTINDSPEAITFSWEVTTTPVSAGASYKPVSTITIDSRTADPDKLAALEQTLYGTPASGSTAAVDAELPDPADVIAAMT
jgi:hypothetical protein